VDHKTYCHNYYIEHKEEIKKKRAFYNKNHRKEINKRFQDRYWSDPVSRACIRKMRAAYARTPKQRRKKLLWMNKQTILLTDLYIKSLIRQKCGIHLNFISQKFITLKRIQILLQRARKETYGKEAMRILHGH
jgi:transposase